MAAIITAGLALAVAGAGAAAAGGRYIPVEPRPLGEIALVRDGGAAVDRGSLAGGWTLLAVGFTHCPDICPMVLANLAAVAAEIAGSGGAPAPRVVFVSVDPARDTPEHLGAYVRHFGDGFIGATGDAKALDRLMKALGAFYRLGRKDKDGHYMVSHTAEIYLIDPDVRLVGRFEPPLDPAQAAGLYRSAAGAASPKPAG